MKAARTHTLLHIRLVSDIEKKAGEGKIWIFHSTKILHYIFYALHFSAGFIYYDYMLSLPMYAFVVLSNRLLPWPGLGCVLYYVLFAWDGLELFLWGEKSEGWKKIHAPQFSLYSLSPLTVSYSTFTLPDGWKTEVMTRKFVLNVIQDSSNGLGRITIPKNFPQAGLLQTLHKLP